MKKKCNSPKNVLNLFLPSKYIPSTPRRMASNPVVTLGDTKLQIDIDVDNAADQLQLIVLIVGISNELFPDSRKGNLPPTGQGKRWPHTRGVAKTV